MLLRAVENDFYLFSPGFGVFVSLGQRLFISSLFEMICFPITSDQSLNSVSELQRKSVVGSFYFDARWNPK
jgi:hypothetical protein